MLHNNGPKTAQIDRRMTTIIAIATGGSAMRPAGPMTGVVGGTGATARRGAPFPRSIRRCSRDSDREPDHGHDPAHHQRGAHGHRDRHCRSDGLHQPAERGPVSAPQFEASTVATDAQNEAQSQGAAAAPGAPASAADTVTPELIFQVLSEVRDALRGLPASRPGT